MSRMNGAISARGNKSGDIDVQFRMSLKTLTTSISAVAQSYLLPCSIGCDTRYLSPFNNLKPTTVVLSVRDNISDSNSGVFSVLLIAD